MLPEADRKTDPQIQLSPDELGASERSARTVTGDQPCAQRSIVFKPALTRRSRRCRARCEGQCRGIGRDRMARAKGSLHHKKQPVGQISRPAGIRYRFDAAVASQRGSSSGLSGAGGAQMAVATLTALDGRANREWRPAATDGDPRALEATLPQRTRPAGR